MYLGGSKGVRGEGGASVSFRGVWVGWNQEMRGPCILGGAVGGWARGRGEVGSF